MGKRKIVQKQLGRCLTLILICSVLNITLAGCIIDDRIEVVKNDEIRFYSINSKTILESLAQGDTNVFTLINDPPTQISSTATASVSWNQADYYRIAQPLQEQAWGEPLGSQNLSSLSLSMNCSEIERGTFGDACFIAERITKTSEEETRIVYRNCILPSRYYVSTTRKIVTPNLYSLETFDLSRYRITAEEALQIAEKKGGMKKRLEVQNACIITAVASGLDSKGWRISYENYPNPEKTYFDVAIDPITSASKVLIPKQ